MGRKCYDLSMHDVYAVTMGIAAAMAAYLAILILWWMLKGFGRSIERLLAPVERRLYQWLQDRATARTLGTDIDVIRVRRKSEFSAH